MKTNHFIVFILLVTAGILSCTSVHPHPGNYGTDQCDFCRMAIVDPGHAAQVITSKGKAYKFDAIECMLRFVDDNSDKPLSAAYVTDYQAEGEWLNAYEATYLVSQQIPSPMGAFLSALKSAKAAESLKQEKTGTVYDWNTVFQIIR
ncbi:MAG: nitrous oxide reductase accessory protein NosL [Saprospiraceae bacterium]